MIRALVVYVAAACWGVALAQDGPVALPAAGDVTGPVGLVLAAAIVRGWTPTIRVVHVQDLEKRP